MSAINGSGGNAIIPTIKTGMTNLLSEIRMNLYSTSTNPVFSKESSLSRLESEARKLSKRKAIEDFLRIAEKSPDLLFESDTDALQNASKDRDVISARMIAERNEIAASHTIGASAISLLTLVYVMWSYSKELFG
jgi:hypothetical protein